MASIKQKETIFNHGQQHCWLGHPSESKTSYVVCAHSPMKSEVNVCHTTHDFGPSLEGPPFPFEVFGGQETEKTRAVMTVVTVAQVLDSKKWW